MVSSSRGESGVGESVGSEHLGWVTYLEASRGSQATPVQVAGDCRDLCGDPGNHMGLRGEVCHPHVALNPRN